MNNLSPNRLEDHVGYWLRCLSNYVHDSFAKRLAKHDVSVAQWVVLRILYDKEDITLNEAAQIVGVDKSSLSRMIERLVKKKLVKRIADKKDRRLILISLSENGKKLVPLLAKEADLNDEAFFHSLTKKEQQDLIRTVKELLIANGWEKSERGWDLME